MLAALMSAAEAAQGKLASKGPIAEEMNRNKLLRSMVESFSSLQKLYHTAALRSVQGCGLLAASPAGLSYALLCAVPGTAALSRNNQGMTLTEQELCLLEDAAKKLAVTAADQQLLQVASQLMQPSSIIHTTSQLFVMG